MHKNNKKIMIKYMKIEKFDDKILKKKFTIC